MAVDTPAILSGDSGDGISQEACAGPPCGYIVPLLALDFPDKPHCPGYGADVNRSMCIPLPALGGAFKAEGTMTWYWNVSQDGIYPNEPTQDIVVRLGASTINPAGLELAVEPAAVTLTTVDLLDPRRYVVDAEHGNRVLYVYEVPITVTLTRTGDVDTGGRENDVWNGFTPEDRERIETQGGYAAAFLRATSNASGDRFKEGFGLEEFRFSDPGFAGGEQGRSASAPVGPVLAASLLALAAFVRMRR